MPQKTRKERQKEESPILWQNFGNLKFGVLALLFYNTKNLAETGFALLFESFLSGMFLSGIRNAVSKIRHFCVFH